MTSERVTIYTDGGCRGNPGLGAWAVVLIRGEHRKELSGVEPETTNNRMELTAAIEALKQLKDPSAEVDFYTDSEYVRKGITEWMASWIARGWKTSAKKPVRNRDLWEILDALTKRHEITWHWVRGHSGDPENERCDELLNFAMDRYLAS